MTDTKFHKKIKNKNLARRTSLIPVKKMASADDIANYIIFLIHENNFIVNAQFKYQTKINLSEDFGGSNWIYSIVNDSVIEKSKSTGGNTSYFYKTDKSYLDELLEFDECNY